MVEGDGGGEERLRITAAEHSTMQSSETNFPNNSNGASNGALETRTARLTARNAASTSSVDATASTKAITSARTAEQELADMAKIVTRTAGRPDDGDIIDDTAFCPAFTSIFM